jgi:hypothetical protein
MSTSYIGAHPGGKALTGFFARALTSQVLAATAAAAVAGLTLAMAGLIDGDYLRSGSTAAYWPRNPIDDFAFASIEAKRAGDKVAGRPALVLVGTAAMREGLLPADEIQSIISKRKGREIPVVNLLTGGQSPMEAAGLVHEVAPQVKGTLVLAVSPSRMAASTGELGTLLEHPRLAFSNGGVASEAEALNLTMPKQTGLYLLDNIEFYVVRLPSFAAHLLTGKREVNNVQTYLGRGHQSAEEWARDTDILKRRLSTYDRNFETNIAAYRRLIRWIKDNEYPLNVVLLEIPMNPKALAEATAPDFYRNHIDNLKRFCTAEGCTYVNTNPQNVVPLESFYDWSHLSGRPGKEAYTHAFLNEIEGAL